MKRILTGVRRLPGGKRTLLSLLAALVLVIVAGVSASLCSGALGLESKPTPTLTQTITATPSSTPTATAIATPSPSPTATPTPDALSLMPVSPDLRTLRERLAQEVAAFTERVGGSFAVAVTDLQTGQTVHVNGNDLARVPGCTMNFFVLLSTVIDLQAGAYPESSVGTYIAQTIWASDPGTAFHLLRVTGGGDPIAGLWKVNSLLRQELGLTSAIFDHPPAGDNVASLTPKRWQPNSITPLDFNRVLTKLMHGEILDLPWTGYLLEKMSHVKPGLNHLIPSGVTDPNAFVGHKNGYIDYVPYYVDNDIGIVSFERGGERYSYVLTFWSQDNPWVLSDLPLGQTVSRLVWEHFTAVYQ